MNLIKLIFISVGLTFIGLISSCSNSKNMNSSQPQETVQIEFSEERRLNHDLNLKELTVINTIKELTEIYGELADPNIPRSAPIPTFDENSESILVIKPKLKTFTHGDIEIESVEKSNSKIIINYKEIENWEFTENKWDDPIVIIKISEKPSEIQLNKIN